MKFQDSSFNGLKVTLIASILYEPRHEKTGFLHMRNQLRGNCFYFATRKVQSLYFLNPKFQASSHLLRLHNPACVGPGLKHRRLVFSQRGSYVPFDLFYI